MTTVKRQRKMSSRSSVTVNFVYATKFCFDPPFFNGSCPRALSTQYSAHHTSRKSQLARFPALAFFRPEPLKNGGSKHAICACSSLVCSREHAQYIPFFKSWIVACIGRDSVSGSVQRPRPRVPRNYFEPP